MYCVNGNSSWYSDCGPLLGLSVIGGSTVRVMLSDFATAHKLEINTSKHDFNETRKEQLKKRWWQQIVSHNTHNAIGSSCSQHTDPHLDVLTPKPWHKHC